MKNGISESPQALVPSCDLSISSLQSVMIRRVLKRRQLRPDDVLSWSVVWVAARQLSWPQSWDMFAKREEETKEVFHDFIICFVLPLSLHPYQLGVVDCKQSA